MSDQKPREFWIAQGSHADIVCYSEKEAKELEWEKNHIHVIEKSAYDAQRKAWYEERKLNSRDSSRMAKECNMLNGELQQLRADLDLAIEALSDTSSWLHRMSDLKWNDKSYAPKFKAAYIRMTETLAKLKEQR